MHIYIPNIALILYLLLILMLWHRQAIFEWKENKLFCSAKCRIRTLIDTKLPVDWAPTHKPTELSRVKKKLIHIHNIAFNFI